MRTGEPDQPRRRPLWLIICALALFFGLLESAQGWFLYRQIPPNKFWPEALWRALPSWIFLAMLTPGVLWIARTFRLDGPGLPASIAVHFVAGVLFVLLHLSATAWVADWRTAGGPSFSYLFARFVANHAVTGIFTYATVVGLAHVARHHGEERARDLRESRLETDLAEARLSALRAQLQPHFLFNALNAITGLAMNREHEKLVRSVSALSDLLRRVLEGASVPSTSLAREMEFIDRYLEIMSIRFGERLQIERTIDPETRDASVPSLILQPLVENAVLHGVGRTAGVVQVAVRSRREGGSLVLQVENREETLGAISSDASESIPPPRTGVGVSSTRDRLAQLFGADASFVLEGIAEGGTRATIRLPWSEG